MPEEVQLLAFVPHDKEKLVDIWIMTGAGEPRAYKVPLTEGLKKTLNQSREQLEQGGKVRLKKEGGVKDGKGGQDYGHGNQQDQPTYILKDVGSLPAKD
jgi:hypothetical protein